MTNIVPPHDPTAEACLASALLAGVVSPSDLSDLVPASDFFGLVARRVYEAAFDLESRGDRVDVATVAGRLREIDRLDAIGGTVALAQLELETPGIGNPREYATQVRQLAQRRRVIDACRIADAEAHGAIDDHRAWLAKTETLMSSATCDEIAETAVVGVGEILRDLSVDLAERHKGLTPAIAFSGLSGVDRHLRGGYRAGLTYVVAGRPGMGKSALALKSAVETAKRGRHAIFFSLEMPRAELSTRIASLVSRTKHDAIDAEAPGPDVFSALAKVQNEIGSKPLSIVDRHGMSPSRIRSVARQAFASGERNGFPRGLIVVDYLQLMHAEVERGANRERQVSSCSAAMKEIAKELHVPVMVLSQINRGVEDRSVKDKRPQMSDLRESGAIEQDADVIMFPFRPAKYDESLRAETEDAELIFAKFRGGKEGTVKIMWRGSNMEFLTVEHEIDEQLDDLDYAITDPYGGSYS